MSLIPPSPLLSTNKNNNNNTTSSCPGYNSSSMPGTALSTFYTTQTPQQEAGTSITYILVYIFALLTEVQRSRETCPGSYPEGRPGSSDPRALFFIIEVKPTSICPLLFLCSSTPSVPWTSCLEILRLPDCLQDESQTSLLPRVPIPSGLDCISPLIMHFFLTGNFQSRKVDLLLTGC